MSIAEHLRPIMARIAAAAEQAGRRPETVRLIGVSKTHPAGLVAEALAAGIHDFGENRVQEAETKIEAFRQHDAITWHLIGHLQRNKARKAADLFDVVHSLDSLELARALDRGRGETDRPPLDVLLQVNVSGEASKQGFALADWQRQQATLAAFLADVEAVLALPNLRLRGLMTIAPLTDEQDAARATFHSTRLLRDTLAARFPQADWHDLSMGMTDDFEDAIAEGATMVRIGRALFGSRQ